jgi:phenylalanyl-tRNA synthetase beta chain
MLFSGLETIIRNINTRNTNLQLFEFGKTYHFNPETQKGDDVMKRYAEKEEFAIWLTGERLESSWNQKSVEVDFFYLKNVIHNILAKVNFPITEIKCETIDHPFYLEHLIYKYQDQVLVQFGQVHPKVLKSFDIKKPVFYAEFNFELVYTIAINNLVQYKNIPSYPTVKRDLALVLDKNVTYDILEQIAYKAGGSKLKKVSLFDVYEGDKIDSNKKSYALNFVLQHPEKTLTEDEINKIMNKLISAFERECGAKLR